MTDISRLLKAYDNTAALVKESNYLKEDFAKIKSIFEAKKQEPDASIMVYGVYNAGKSTLINALVGKEVAETDDVPKTDKVTEYECGAFKILDTPGIDAPIAHEEVTKQQLLKADAVIFVVNPVGVAEEQKTLDALISLVKAGKKVFLIFNDKDNLSEEDFVHLKEQTYAILQEMADKQGMNNVLSKMPISKIKAKSAFKGRSEGKINLLQSSGFIEFEKELNDFINSVSKDDVKQRLSIELSTFLDKFIQYVKNQSTSKIVESYDILMRKVNKEKVLVKKDIDNQVGKSTNELREQVKFWLNNDDQKFEVSLNTWIETRINLIYNKFNNMLEKASVEIQDDIKDLETSIPSLSKNANIDIQGINIDSKNSIITIDEDHNGPKVSTAELTAMTTTLATQIKTEHIIMGLETLKGIFPGLMKGIGTKTMEKIAGQVIGKAIPVIGTVITIGSSLIDLFGEDEQAAKLRKEKEAYERAKERRNQQIEDASWQISNQFETSVTLELNKATDQFFNEIINKLKEISNQFDKNEHQNSLYLQKALEVKQLFS